MKSIKLIKSILLVSSSLVLAASSTLITFSIPIREKINDYSHNAIFDQLKAEIASQSYAISADEYYSLDGRIFTSENQLNEEILTNGDLKTYVTISKPEDIFLDSSRGILNPKKIETLNLSKFKRVYRTLYNEAVIDKELALESFANDSNLLKQYSYDDINWYDSVEEAKLAKGLNPSVQSSIYYVFDNKYYNAFNSEDIDILISKMQEGYYGLYDHDLSGQEHQIRKIYGTREEFYKKNREQLYEDFHNSYYKKFISYDKSHSLMFHLASSAIQTIVNDVDYGMSDTVKIALNQKAEIKNISNLFVDFLSPEKWHFSSMIINELFWFQYSRLLEIKDEEGNTLQTLDIKLRLPIQPAFLKDPTKGKPESFFLSKLHTIIEPLNDSKENGTVTFYKDSKRLKKLDVAKYEKGITDLTYKDYDGTLKNDQIRYFYDAWYENYFKDTLDNFGEANNYRVNWKDYSLGNFLENLNRDEEFELGHIYKDMFYQANGFKGHDLSLIDSLSEWKEMKKKIISEGDKSADLYKINLDGSSEGGLVVNQEELDKFLWLQGNVDARVMYAVSNERHVSDRKARLLKNTPQEARAIQSLITDDRLRTRFHVRNKIGTSFDSYGDRKEAINDLKKQIKLNSRYVSEEELNRIKDNDYIDWNKLKEKEQHTIYSIKNPNATNKDNAVIWFNSKQSALNALKSNLKIDKDIKVLTDEYKIFNYCDNNGTILPVVYSDSELEKITQKIYKAKYGEKHEKI